MQRRSPRRCAGPAGRPPPRPLPCPFGHSSKMTLRCSSRTTATAGGSIALGRGDGVAARAGAASTTKLTSAAATDGALYRKLRPLILSKEEFAADRRQARAQIDATERLRLPFVADMVGNTIRADLTDYLERDHTFLASRSASACASCRVLRDAGRIRVTCPAGRVRCTRGGWRCFCIVRDTCVRRSHRAAQVPALPIRAAGAGAGPPRQVAADAMVGRFWRCGATPALRRRAG